MAEVWQRIRAAGERVWRSATEKTPGQEGVMLTPPPFYPFRGFDNPAEIGVAALLEASLRRREREDLGGIDQEGFISTNRLLWLAGMALTWAGSGAAAYKAAEMWMGSDDASGPLRIAGSLAVSFVATSIVNELFLRRLVRT